MKRLGSQMKMPRSRLLRVAVALVAALAIAGGAWAYWTTQGSGTASATAGTLSAPTNVSASAGSSVSVSWTGSTLSNGTPAQGYYVTRTNTSTSQTAAACDSSPSSLVTDTSCSDTGVPSGTYTYKVTAVHHSWTAESAASNEVTVQSGEVTPPSITVSFPSEGGLYRSASWSGGCSPDTGICGTASDSSGVASVEVSILRASTGRYWDGSGFNSTSEDFRVAIGTTSWHYDLALPPDDDYTVHVRATDTVGNTTSSLSYLVRHFRIDATAPTISASAKNADNSTYTAGTWTKQTVTVHYTCGDPTVNGTSSGVATCPSDQVFSSDTSTTASGTATDNAGNSADSSFQVKVDKTASANALSLTSQSTQAGPAVSTNATSYLSGSTLWYAGGVAGSFKLQNALTDNLSGSASSSYAALGGTTTGWSFTGSTVTTPSGGPYASNLLSWTSPTTSQPSEGVTGTDAAGNANTATTLNFKNDNASPTDTITSPVTNGDYTDATWDASPCSTGTICGTTTDTGPAPSFGSSSSAANASGGASTLVLSKPASVATDDVLIAAVSVSAGASAITSVPSGWTQVRTANQSSNVAVASYYHVVTNAASEPASYSWGLASSTRASGGINRYTGVDTSSPIDVSAGAAGNNTASVQAPSITTTSNSDLVVGVFSINANTNFTPPSGTSERYDVTNTNSGGPATESADFEQAAAGSTGAKTATAGTSGSWAAQLIALNPAPSTASNTSGLAKVQVSVQATSGASSGKYWDPAANGGTGGFTSSSEVLTLASGTTNWSLDFPASNFTDASYTVRAYAVDNVGNYTTTPASSTNVSIDNVAPTTTDNTASIGSAWRNTNTTVTLTPTDAASGVGATYYTTNGSTPTTSSSQGTSISLTNTGVYTIKYFSVDNAGNQEAVKTASTQIRIDKTTPTSSLAIGSATGAYLSGTTLYYKGNAAGSFSFVNSVTDADSGTASTTFPAISTTGWTHNLETVGGASPYTSSTYSWNANPSTPSSKSITSTDAAGNTSSRSISFTSDAAAPSGGALTVNGTAANTSGSTSTNTSGTFSITTLTQYTDSGSGLASSALVREEASLSADGTGTCDSTWTNPTTISGATPISQSATTGTCYRYTLSGADNVGNTASIRTIVKVDATAPTAPALAVTTSGNYAYADGTTVYYNGTTGTSSSFTVSATTSDPQSGIQKVNFPALTSFTGGGDKTSSPYSSTYTWTTSSDSGSKTVTAYNGLANTATGTFSLVRDVTAPSGGALTVNGVAASGTGSTSSATTTGFAIDTRTDYAEAQSASQSGLASGTLTIQSETLSGSGTCGAPGSGGPFTSPTTISGTTQPSGIVAGFCYLYTLTGTDNVGNTDSVKTTVAVADAFQLSNPGTRTAGTAFSVTITAVFDGATDTSYTGTKTITFSGPASSPSGTAPSYPASVTFTNGVGTANITLYKAETTSLTAAAQGAITGTSPSFTVNAGSAARIAWTSISTSSAGTPTPNPCYFTCTYSSGFGNSNTWNSKASITDSAGNIVAGVGSGHNVTVALGGSRNGTINGGTANVTLTIPATGAATSTSQLAYLAGSGSSWTDTLSATSSGFTNATASFSK
jgi:hypothetical protein